MTLLTYILLNTDGEPMWIDTLEKKQLHKWEW